MLIVKFLYSFSLVPGATPLDNFVGTDHGYIQEEQENNLLESQNVSWSKISFST